MQTTNTVNDILQNISSLILDDQIFIADILKKRVTDLKRAQLFQRAKEAEFNYENGKTASGGVSDLMRAINDD